MSRENTYYNAIQGHQEMISTSLDFYPVDLRGCPKDSISLTF